MSRTVLVKVRATEAERQQWREKAEAAGLSLSDLVRQSLSKVRTWTAQDREAADARTRELAKLGNNLNQIARWANTYKTAADTVQVIAYLRAIEQELRRVADAD